MPRKPQSTVAQTPSEGFSIEPKRLDAVRVALLAWFAANGRDLPWRHTRDPYRIMVSEVMLQQIQVGRAIPFYLAFLGRFPTLHDLASAPLADAIRVWGDLGRYKRVVNLHRAARLIVAEHGGEVPGDEATLRRLPGIGPYTAGAIACFAFEQETGFIDTNMRRVLHRIFVGADVPTATASDAELTRLARQAVPPGRAWEWNQGLMDFGATLCTARRPSCAICPIQSDCRAYPGILPALAEQPKRPTGAKPAFRYEDSNRYYRGRVLARLRDHSLGASGDEGIALPDLGAQVRGDFTEEQVPWLYGVVESLTKDGLAVAEERPTYSFHADPPGDEREIRVKLP